MAEGVSAPNPVRAWQNLSPRGKAAVGVATVALVVLVWWYRKTHPANATTTTPEGAAVPGPGWGVGGNTPQPGIDFGPSPTPPADPGPVDPGWYEPNPDPAPSIPVTWPNIINPIDGGGGGYTTPPTYITPAPVVDPYRPGPLPGWVDRGGEVPSSGPITPGVANAGGGLGLEGPGAVNANGLRTMLANATPEQLSSPEWRQTYNDMAREYIAAGKANSSALLPPLPPSTTSAPVPVPQPVATPAPDASAGVIDLRGYAPTPGEVAQIGYGPTVPGPAQGDPIPDIYGGGNMATGPYGYGPVVSNNGRVVAGTPETGRPGQA